MGLVFSIRHEVKLADRQSRFVIGRYDDGSEDIINIRPGLFIPIER